MKPWIKVLLGLFLGIILRLMAKQEIAFLKLVGKIFINLLKILVGFILFTSIAPGICHIRDPKKVGRIGYKTFLYYFFTTLIPISFGLLSSFFLQPGKGLSIISRDEVTGVTKYSVVTFITSLIRGSPIASLAEANVLQIIVFSMFFTYPTILCGAKGRAVLHIIESFSEIMYALARFIMKLVPYGVFALMATAVGWMGLKVIFPLPKFLIANYIAFFLLIFLIFGGSIPYLAKLEVMPFFKGMKDTVVLAFTTSSSIATLSVSLVIVTAGIPGTGIVMLSIVLNELVLRLKGVALLTGVDRIREMLSAVTNILGDTDTAVFVATSEKEINEKQYCTVTWLE